MAKELVKPPITELSENAVATCKMIERYFDNNNVNEFSVCVNPNGSVSIVTEQPVETEFAFTL